MTIDQKVRRETKKLFMSTISQKQEEFVQDSLDAGFCDCGIDLDEDGDCPVCDSLYPV